MTRADHQEAFDELTAYLDGELTPEDAGKVRAHLASCAECREVEADLRGVSGRLASWTLEEPPPSLTAPLTGQRSWRMRQWLPLAAALLLALGTTGWWVSREAGQAPLHVMLGGAEAAPTVTTSARPISASSRHESASIPIAESPAEQVQQPRPLQVQQPGPLLVQTARLSIVAADFDAARTGMERIVTEAGGFTGNIQASGNRGSTRSLRATLRIPEARLPVTIDALKRLGQITHESRNADDVTQQSADLDARLANARMSEKRLKDILQMRTGELSDVLSVEREIARVRGDIERMEADRKTLDTRITYATVAVQLDEEEKSAMDLGPMSVSARLRNAFIEGWRTAFSSGLGATLIAVRVAPTLLLWALVLALPAWYVRRRIAG